MNDQDDIFILVAPQNAMGNCIIDVTYAIPSVALQINIISFSYCFEIASTIIINSAKWKCKNWYSCHFNKCCIFLIVWQDLQAMVEATGRRPMILVNPRLKVTLHCLLFLP